jgi:putative peptidoglycan lipid II flippase
MSEHKTIFKSASVISFITIVSRITGFIRDVLIANIFGTGVPAQAFFVAFKIPNVFRDIMGEGAGNAAFVPVFCEYLVKKTKTDFLRLVNSLLLILLALSSVIVLLGIIFCVPLVRVIAPGFLQDKAKFDLTVNLTRLLFPYLVLITASAYLMAISNAHQSFIVPASSSVVSNIVLIFFIFFIGRMAGINQIYALGIAVLIAGLAQVLMQLPQIFKMGINFKRGGIYPQVFREEAIRKVGRLIAPRIVGTSIYQLNIFVDTIFASMTFFAGEGAIAAIYYANRIIQFPFAVFGIALSNAALPQMSAHSAQKDMEPFKKTLAFCLKTVFLGIIPLTIGLLLFATPLVRVIFQRGSFDAYSTSITATAVFFYSLGLVSFISVRFLSHAFYALQDTVTPVKTSALGVFLNVILLSLFIFVLKLQVAGLALASSLSASVNFYMLYRILKKRVGFSFDFSLRQVLFKSLGASLGMALVAFWVWERWFSAHPSFMKMIFVGCLGGILYAGFLWFLKVEEVKGFLSWLLKKR